MPDSLWTSPGLRLADLCNVHGDRPCATTPSRPADLLPDGGNRPAKRPTMCFPNSTATCIVGQPAGWETHDRGA